MHADAPPFDYMRPVGFIVHLSLEGHKSRDVRAMDQGGQRRDQVDAAVVPNVRRQRRLSCKRAGKTRTLMPVWDSSGEFGSIRPNTAAKGTMPDRSAGPCVSYGAPLALLSAGKRDAG